MTDVPVSGDRETQLITASDLEAEVAVLRAATLDHWIRVGLSRDSSSPAFMDKGAIEQELHAMRESMSWRITAPLRAVRQRF